MYDDSFVWLFILRRWSSYSRVPTVAGTGYNLGVLVPTYPNLVFFVIKCMIEVFLLYYIMAKRKPEENFNVDEDELANMFGDADSSPPTKRAMTPAEAWDAIEEKNAALRKSQTPISELDKVPTMEEITGGPQETGGTRKMRRSGKARKMKTKKSSKSRSRKSTRRRHKNRRTR